MNPYLSLRTFWIQTVAHVRHRRARQRRHQNRSRPKRASNRNECALAEARRRLDLYRSRKIATGRALLLRDNFSRLRPSLYVMGGERWLLDITNCLSDRIGVARHAVDRLVIRASQRARPAHSIGAVTVMR